MKELRVRFLQGAAAVSSTHTIFLKQHSVRKDSSFVPSGKTLISLGWPPYCSKESIAELFSRAGQVVSVYIRDQPGSVEEIEASSCVPSGRFHVAYIIFSSAEEVLKGLQLASSSTIFPCSVSHVGLSKWATDYQQQYPATASVMAEVEEKIAAYDIEKAAAKELSKKGVTEPDADGWVTVTRKTAPRLSKKQDRKKQKKSLQLVNMYQFQQRETQRQHIAELRKKFNEDKQRVAIMRSQRKFKPF